jgi:hypothetical protein
MNPHLTVVELLWLLCGTLLFFLLFNWLGERIANVWRKRRTR